MSDIQLGELYQPRPGSEGREFDYPGVGSGRIETHLVQDPPGVVADVIFENAKLPPAKHVADIEAGEGDWRAARYTAYISNDEVARRLIGIGANLARLRRREALEDQAA